MTKKKVAVAAQPQDDQKNPVIKKVAAVHKRGDPEPKKATDLTVPREGKATKRVATAAAKKAPAQKKAKPVAAPEPVISDADDQMSPEEIAIHERMRRAQEIIHGYDLQPRAKLFVVEYTKDLNATQAAIRAGYSKETAQQQGSRLLLNVVIKQAIDAVMNDRIEQGIFDGDAIIAKWVEISQANPNSLTQYRRVCCRFCYGENFRYQFTPSEWEEEVGRQEDQNIARKIVGAEPLPIDYKGGLGFVGNRDPHPECPECWGEGVGRPFFTDTRKLDAASLPLFAGVKQTKEGLEIQTHSQADARDKLARHFGLYKDKLAEALEQNWTAESLETLFSGSIAAAQAKARQIAQEREALKDNGEDKDTAARG